MKKKYDAVIIGAGIIGCCISFELCKKGYKTLNIDKLPAAGYGSTSNSCAIIRLHYSTSEGVAMAREGYFYWLDWSKYLEMRDTSGMAYYRNTGALVIKTETNKNLKNVMATLDDLGVGYLELEPKDLKSYLPIVDLHSYYPCKTLNHKDFGKPSGDRIVGAIWVPESGYISDPKLSTHNVQVASENKGGEFMFNAEVVEILKRNNRAAGVRLQDNTTIESPVVVNVAGPHSFIVNRMADVEKTMKIKTRALKQEVCHVPDVEYGRE
jgi:sarcosine oxidase subunit beta